MQKTLKEIVTYFVDHNFPDIENDANKIEIMNASKLQLEHDLEEQIKTKYKSELKSQIKQEIQEETIKNKIKEAKNLLVFGAISAFIIGIIVNQTTDIITYLKTGISEKPWVITLIIIAGCALICYLIYKTKFIDEALIMIEKKGRNHKNEED